MTISGANLLGIDGLLREVCEVGPNLPEVIRAKVLAGDLAGGRLLDGCAVLRREFANAICPGGYVSQIGVAQGLCQCQVRAEVLNGCFSSGFKGGFAFAHGQSLTTLDIYVNPG